MKRGLLEGLVDTKRLSLFVVLSKNPEKIFSLTEISNESKVPIATVMRLMRGFVENDLAEQVKVGKIKLYKFAKNKKTDRLVGLING